MKREEIFNKSLDCLLKLDGVILSKVEKYEKYHTLEKLKTDIHKYITIFDDYKFNIIDIRTDKFELDYLIYLNDDYVININMNFSKGGQYIFFMYNYIYIVSKDGEVLHDWTNDLIAWLNEE